MNEKRSPLRWREWDYKYLADMDAELLAQFSEAEQHEIAVEIRKRKQRADTVQQLIHSSTSIDYEKLYNLYLDEVDPLIKRQILSGIVTFDSFASVRNQLENLHAADTFSTTEIATEIVKHHRDNVDGLLEYLAALDESQIAATINSLAHINIGLTTDNITLLLLYASHESVRVRLATTHLFARSRPNDSRVPNYLITTIEEETDPLTRKTMIATAALYDYEDVLPMLFDLLADKTYGLTALAALEVYSKRYDMPPLAFAPLFAYINARLDDVSNLSHSEQEAIIRIIHLLGTIHHADNDSLLEQLATITLPSADIQAQVRMAAAQSLKKLRT